MSQTKRKSSTEMKEVEDNMLKGMRPFLMEVERRGWLALALVWHSGSSLVKPPWKMRARKGEIGRDQPEYSSVSLGMRLKYESIWRGDG